MQIVKMTKMALAAAVVVAGLGMAAPDAYADDVYVEGKLITAQSYDSAMTRESTEEPADLVAETEDTACLCLLLPAVQ
jgi:hypothetical protein